MDWLTTWGVNNSIGFFFKEILIELSRDGASKYSQALFSEIRDSNLELTCRTNLQILTGQLIKEFLALFQQELEDADLDDIEILAYRDSLEKFIFNSEFQTIVKNSLYLEDLSIDYKQFQELWLYLKLLDLPDDFEWRRISKRYQRRIKSITRELSNFTTTNIEQSNGDKVAGNKLTIVNNLDRQLIQYRKSIQEQYSNLRLDSLDTSGAAYDQLKLWRIFIAQNVREVREFIPQVYEIPKEHQKMLRESGQLDEEELTLKELEEYNQFYSQQPLQSVLEVVEDIEHKHIVILGDPGSGKSTLLQYITLQWAELPEQQLAETSLPLLIELRTYNREKQAKQCQSLLDFFSSQSSIISGIDQDCILDKLSTGQITILFDGLDEVFEPSQREQVITEIIQFTQKYPEIKVIVTSRVIGYKQKTLAEQDFTHFMLQDLDSTQVDDFINRWHDLTFYDRIDKERKRDRLKKAINESPAIQELSGNPLLLTMMAILNRNQELPRDRAELYNQSSRVLLHQWDTERALEDARLKPISLDYKDKQAMLRQVAYFMQANTQGLAGNSITASDLKRILSEYLATLSTTQDLNPDDIAEVLIHQLRTRNFILCFLGAEYYAFVHRTFLEYFCAWEFVWQFEKARTIDIEGLKDIFSKHWQDESWHEVLRLITGMIDSKFAGEIIEFLMQQKDHSGENNNLLIAANCLIEVRNRTAIESISRQLLTDMKSVVETEYKQEKGENFLYTIAYVWKENLTTYNWLEEQVKDNSNYRIRANALQAITKVFNDKNTWKLLQYLARFDKTITVRKLAVENILKKQADDENTLPFIMDIARNEQKFSVISSILNILTNKNDSTTAFQILKICLSHNFYTDASEGAIREIIKYCQEYSETYQILEQIIIYGHRDRFISFIAIKELSKIWRGYPKTFHIIKQSATYSRYHNVRITAIKELAQGWQEHPETFSIIKQSAVCDQDKYVREIAIKELAQGWQEHPETFSIIKQSATSGKDHNVRRTAISELAQGWKEHPETFSIIKQAAVCDQNEYVREIAIKELAQGWKEHPETFSIIKQAAVCDQDKYVKITAISELANGWKGNSEISEILCDRAINDTYNRQSDFETIPRQIALQIIVEQYKDRPEILPLLRDRATNDPDEKIREFAQEQLEKLTK
ncbi:MAG: NACHT domain-containing protein [Cyanobacteria bacterium P01_G01_bin.39]